MEFIIDNGASDEALTEMAHAAETQITHYRKSIAQLEQIRDMAKLKMISRELEAAERE